MKKVLFFILFSFLSCTGRAQSEDCSLKKDKDGIKVYTCKAENERFKVLKAEFVIHNILPHELERFLQKVPNYPTWQYNMISARIIHQKKDDDSFIIRSEIDAPWPVENRELVAQFSVKRFDDEDKLQFTVKTIPYDYPTTKGIIRVPFSHAQWDVKRTGSSTSVSYTMRIDPGGALPVWLVNMAMAEGPYSTFVNLKKQLENK